MKITLAQGLEINPYGSRHHRAAGGTDLPHSLGNQRGKVTLS